jgi:hypothetical protein
MGRWGNVMAGHKPKKKVDSLAALKLSEYKTRQVWGGPVMPKYAESSLAGMPI